MTNIPTMKLEKDSTFHQFIQSVSSLLTKTRRLKVLEIQI